MDRPRKRRVLNYEKCTFCRKDKKKCEPTTRIWPGEKCNRCIEIGLACSENQRVSKRRACVIEPGQSLPPPPPDDSGRDSDVSKEKTMELSNAGCSEDEWYRRCYWYQHFKRVYESIDWSNPAYSYYGPEEEMRKESRALRDLKNAIKSLCGKIYEGSIASDSLALNARLEIGKALLCTTTPYILDWPLSDEGFDDLQNLIRKSVAAGQLHHTVQLQATLLSNCHLPDEPLDSLITEEAFRAELLAYQVTHETLFRDFSGELIHGKTLPHLSDMSIDLAIRCGVFLESKDILDRSLLHLALVCKREDVDIDRLINISTSIDSQDFIGMRPIHLACWHGNVAAVQALIGRGASLTSKVGAAEWLPWHFAALSGDSRLVETLMDTLGSNGLGINCQTRRKETALRIAVCRRHESVVEMLLARGADPTIPDDSDRNCLHMAVQSGSCYLVQLLLWGTYGPTLNVQLGWSRYTPLHWIIVIEGGKNVGIIIKILLHHDSTNANAEDNYGNTPLQLAVKYQHLEAVKALLTSNKVLTNRKDSAGRTPLFIAAGQGYDRIVEVLLRSGRVTANISDNYGWTPLSISIEKGHTKAAQLIQRFLYRSQGMPLAPGTCWP